MKIIVTAACVCTMALSGCLPGTSPELNAMSYAEAREKVRVGMSMAQVERIMGKPPQSSTFNGESTWAYVSVSLGANARNPFTVRSGVSTKVLSVRFDRSGKVKAVDFQESAG